MEQFEGKLENDESEFQKKEMVMSTEDHFDEVAEQANLYFPNELIKRYSEKTNELLFEFNRIQNYLSAKGSHSELAKQLSDILTERPISGVSKEQKESQLQKCEQIIHSFEKEGVPEEVLVKAKASAKELYRIIEKLSSIKEIATYGPELN